MYYTNNENYLQHHGILGQKWGIRRYQNPDGTLTEAGKKRISGDKVYQGKMTNKQREEYAKNRVAKNDGDAMQAIDDEKDAFIKKQQDLTKHFAVNAIGHMGLAAGALALSEVCTPAAIALGAAWVVNAGDALAGTIIRELNLQKAAENTDRNINVIKRQNGISDISVTTARGSDENNPNRKYAR